MDMPTPVCACLQKPEMANDHPRDKISARLGSSSQQRMCILRIRERLYSMLLGLFQQTLPMQK